MSDREIFVVLLAAALLAVVPRADASDQTKIAKTAIDPSVEIDSEIPQTAPIDEVVVTRQKSVSQLRVELTRTDYRLFKIYNEINADDSMDMICKMEARIGSQIRYQVCKSSLHRDLESETASDFLEGAEASSLTRLPAGHYANVRSNLSDLMSEHPELAEIFRRRAELRQKIAELKSQK